MKLQFVEDKKLSIVNADCYVPELKMGKRKRVSLDLMDMTKLPKILELEYSVCTISHVEDRTEVVTKTLVRTQEDVVRRRSCNDAMVQKRPDSCLLTYQHRMSRKRWSMPAMDVMIKEKEKPVKQRTRELFEAKDVGPPKQVKYFCKKCKVDVCNECFRTVCSSHTVQWMGQACFHCASPYHKIVHEHESFESE